MVDEEVKQKEAITSMQHQPKPNTAIANRKNGI